jgi:ferredoxin, 2Fe-2S
MPTPQTSPAQPGSEVYVEPGGAHFDVRPGESFIQAAWRAGYQWPTTCWGQAECGACAMEVLDGSERLSATEPLEAARLRALPRRGGTTRRLACQAQIALAGTVTVHKPGVRLRATEATPPAT